MTGVGGTNKDGASAPPPFPRNVERTLPFEPRGVACSNTKPPPPSPPLSRPPKIFKPIFLQFEILGESVGAKGADFFFLAC